MFNILYILFLKMSYSFQNFCKYCAYGSTFTVSRIIDLSSLQ